MEIKHLIKKMRRMENKLYKLKEEIRMMSDGYIYLTKLRVYGSITWDTHLNKYSVQELCNEYTGENGIVDVFSNNPNLKINNYGSVKFMTTEGMTHMTKENISMSQAFVDRIVQGMVPVTMK